MNQEIERKFFLTEYPHDRIASGELQVTGRKTIDQTYLALTETEEIRVRKLSSDSAPPTYTHTYKRGHGLSRGEVEYEISAELYQQLLDESDLKPLIKTRTKVLDPLGRTFELDDH